MPTKPPIFVLVAAALAASTTRADLVYFQKGGELQAPASTSGKRVSIELPDGTHEFLREDFRKLVPGFNPAAEWPGRIAKARAAGFAARYEAVWWGIENGLVSEVAPEIRALHAADPGHAPAARMAAALDRLGRPCTDPEIDAFRKALGVSMNVVRGDHVLLLHQATDAEAAERLALLERVITSYYLLFAAQGIELAVPGRRLVFALFATQDDYLSFLRAQNAAAFSTTQGYFHPNWNAVVAYDGRGSDRQQTGRETARARREELKSFQATVDRLPRGAKLRVTLTGESARTLDRAQALDLIEKLQREVRREEILLDLEHRAIDDGTAAHEMIHLLAANSGLLPRHDAFPVWLQEGLAMQFEVIRGGRWAGIGRAHDLRLPDWRKIQPPPPLEPLVRDSGFGRGYRRELYAQAWALVHYLRARHPQQFLTFLDLLRSPDARSADLSRPDRTLDAFHRAFGTDLEPLERDWHAYLVTLKTPLELHAPAAAPGPAPARPVPRRPARTSVKAAGPENRFN
jgi:hypothetical protein